jgi:penicillin-binding protein 2
VGILPMDLPPADQPERGAVIAKLAQLLVMPQNEIQAKVDKAKNDPYSVVTIREDVPKDTIVAYLKEHSLEFPGVRVETSYLRQYPLDPFATAAKGGGAASPLAATHVLGYVGEITQAELSQEEFRSSKAGTQVGQDGVERVYDSFLRGTDGSTSVEVDAAGQPKRVLDQVSPLPGNNLVLTIDSELQSAAEKALKDGILRAHSAGFKKAAAGAIVAIDPSTGEILAMASYPDYDPSLWVGGMSQSAYKGLTAAGAHDPLFNRALNGQYPAGSTFKPFVAAAALGAGLITSQTTFKCTGKFTVPQQTWKCWKTDGHGTLNLLEALQQSCDVYFYNLGKLLYEQPTSVLQDRVRQFGFGSATQVDLPGEDPSEGRVPDTVWKEKTGKTPADRVWKLGDDINLAIGQGDLLVTPLQLATGFAAIANGGQVVVPHLGKEITDSTGNVIHTFEVKKRNAVDLSPEALQAIRRGLLLSTSEPLGTGYKAFKGFPIQVVGKTGTAQKAPEEDYALFMGYAPANNPKILVVAVVEQGGSSSIAALVVRQVMEAEFHTGTPIPTVQEVTH